MPFLRLLSVLQLQMELNATTSSTHISARLVEQMSVVENIIKGLKYQKDETFELDWLIEDLTKLDEEFNSFESIKSLDIDEVDMEHLKLTDTELGQLKEHITALRTKIVNG